eukprot:3277059-Lingulodinium_polyedra.AAC.1
MLNGPRVGCQVALRWTVRRCVDGPARVVRLTSTIAKRRLNSEGPQVLKEGLPSVSGPIALRGEHG